MDGDETDVFLRLQAHRTRTSASTSPPSARSTPALTQHTLSVSSLATSLTLPDYPSSLTLSRHTKRTSRSLGSWSSFPADVEVPSDYKSPPASIPGFNVPDYASEHTTDSFTSPYDAVYAPQPLLTRHRSQLSTSSARSHEEIMEARLDDLVERSVHALEISNHLLSQSIDGGVNFSDTVRPRSSESTRGRRRDRMPLYPSRNRWADEPVLEEEEGENNSWEDSAYVGSLPERSYLSPSPTFRDMRPHTLARTSSYNSMNGSSSASPSLDSYRFPSPHHQKQASTSGRNRDRISPSPAPSSSTPSRSSSVRTSRPPPLHLSASEVFTSPQVSATSSQHSTPAYQLVSSILSREAAQQRRIQTAQAGASSSQLSTPPPSSFMPFTRAKPAPSPRSSVDMGRSSYKRKIGRLPASISVPDDIGKWMRSLEPVNPSDTLVEQPAGEPEILHPQPRSARVISPSLPESPPTHPVALFSPSSSSASGTLPHSQSISQLRTILGAQPSPPLPLPLPRKRPQFQPLTPQLPSTHLTAPPGTRSQSVPPVERDAAPSPLPSSVRRLKGKSSESKHVSFSPTPTDIPSRATSPGAQDAPASKPSSSSGWAFVEWLFPRKSYTGQHPESSKKKPKKAIETSISRSRTWTVDSRPDWNDRTAESWLT